MRVYDRALSTEEIKRLYTHEMRRTEPAFLKKGLVAYYPFNGNAKDESGNDSDGQLIGATLTEDRFGKAKSALKTGRVNGRIAHMKAPDAKLPMGDSARTVSCFFKADQVTLPHLHECFVIGYGAMRFNQGFYIIENGAANAQNGQFFFSQWGEGIDIKKLNAKQWYMITVTYQDGELVAYVDGKEIVRTKKLSSNRPLKLATSHGSLTVGGLVNERWLPGTLDDVRIYDRALSVDEVKELYNWEKLKP